MPSDQIIFVETDTSELNKALHSLKSALQEDGKEILITEHRALIRTIVNFTPPMPRQQAKQVGEYAVKEDIKSLISEAGSDFLDGVVSEYGVRDIDAHRTTKSGKDTHLLWDHIIFNQADIPALHNQYRNRRGRIPKGKAFGQGVWNARIVVPKGQRDPYIREVQSHVGRWKARWAYCGRQLGDEYPAWISRHFWYVSKDATHKTELSKEDALFIQSGGRGPNFAENMDKIRAAISFRAKAIQRRVLLVVSDYAKDVANRLKARAKAHGQDVDYEEVN